MSAWSSAVCSSDLPLRQTRAERLGGGSDDRDPLAGAGIAAKVRFVGIGGQARRREQEGRKVRGQQFVQLRIGGGPIDQGSEIVADNHLTGGGGDRKSVV